MKGTEYSPYKCLYHLESLKADRPVECYWLITHRCNYRCSVCINKHMDEYVAGQESSAAEILDYGQQLKRLGVKALSISGGEPLLHRDIETVLSGLLEMGFDIGMISNGSLITPSLVPLLKRLTWFRISVNARSKESYEAVHGIPFDRSIWDMFQEVVPEIAGGDCVVGSSFLVQPGNLHELHDFAVWSKAIGFDTCRYSYVRKSDGQMMQFGQSEKSSIVTQLSEARKLEDEEFKVFGLSDRLALASKKSYTHCYMSDLTVTLTANDSVYRCCSLQNTRTGNLGSLKEISLAEIWYNRGSQDLAKCPQCWQDTKNVFLEYASEPNPRHVNFV